jgi:Holin of 3TMs, for gene-transfer release
MLAIITALLPLITKVFDKAIADPSERAKAQEEVTKALLENQATIFEGMKAVMVADAQAESPLTRNARPIVVYWSLSVISLIVVAAAFGFAGPILDALKAVPDKLWDLMTYGIGAYVLGRSAEKAVTNGRGK